MTSSATSKRSTFYEDPQSSRETDHSSVSGITPAKIGLLHTRKNWSFFGHEKKLYKVEFEPGTSQSLSTTIIN